MLKGYSISQGYFYQKRFQKIFDQWTVKNKYDAVICFSSPMAEYIFRSSHPIKAIADKLIMDFCDLDSDKFRQYADNAKTPLNWIYKKEGQRLLTFEKKN
jgi:hypothetical protein